MGLGSIYWQQRAGRQGGMGKGSVHWQQRADIQEGRNGTRKCKLTADGDRQGCSRELTDNEEWE
jgi:hypothetical protein